MIIMSQTYHHRNLKFAAADETDVILEVKYVSDVNSSHTVINRPGDVDLDLDGQGTITIGKGKELRGETTYITTSVDNIAPQVENIRVQFKLNGQEIVLHSNPRSETPSPIIILHLTFPAQ